jgi:hypothetical protein
VIVNGHHAIAVQKLKHLASILVEEGQDFQLVNVNIWRRKFVSNHRPAVLEVQ